MITSKHHLLIRTLILLSLASLISVAKAADPAKGIVTFNNICAACHGAKGEGGIGLPLKNILSRFQHNEVIEKIKNPKPPMPALYPSFLNEEAVADVAAFIETL